MQYMTQPQFACESAKRPCKSVQIVENTTCDKHCLLLAQDEAHVLQAASGVSAEVATSDTFALAPIKAAVQVYNLKLIPQKSVCHIMVSCTLLEPLPPVL